VHVLFFSEVDCMFIKCQYRFNVVNDNDTNKDTIPSFFELCLFLRSCITWLLTFTFSANPHDILLFHIHIFPPIKDENPVHSLFVQL